MKHYIERFIIPFITQKREALKLDISHQALALFDCFRGQTTACIEALLEENNIVSVQIPPNCTDKLQSMDILVNKPMKVGLRTRFQNWCEIQKQLKVVALDEVQVSVTASSIKPHSAKWIISTWQEIEKRPDLASIGSRLQA